MPVGEVRPQPQPVCDRETRFKSRRTHYRKLTQSKFGQAPQEMTEWIQDKYNFLKTGQDSTNLQPSSSWSNEPVQLQPQHEISRGSTYTNSMEMSMQSDTTQQPRYIFQCSTVDQPAMDQLALMKSEDHAVVFSWAKAGDHQNSLPKLLGI